MFVFPIFGAGCMFDILYPHNWLNSCHRKIIASFADVTIPYDRASWNVSHCVHIASLAFEHRPNVKSRRQLVIHGYVRLHHSVAEGHSALQELFITHHVRVQWEIELLLFAKCISFHHTLNPIMHTAAYCRCDMACNFV